MTDQSPETPPVTDQPSVEEARRDVAGAHSLTCPRNNGMTMLCSCGGVNRPIPHLDRYAAAVRRDTLREVREKVADTGARWIDRVRESSMSAEERDAAEEAYTRYAVWVLVLLDRLEGR